LVSIRWTNLLKVPSAGKQTRQRIGESDVKKYVQVLWWYPLAMAVVAWIAALAGLVAGAAIGSFECYK